MYLYISPLILVVFSHMRFYYFSVVFVSLLNYFHFSHIIDPCFVVFLTHRVYQRFTTFLSFYEKKEYPWILEKPFEHLNVPFHTVWKLTTMDIWYLFLNIIRLEYPKRCWEKERERGKKMFKSLVAVFLKLLSFLNHFFIIEDVDIYGLNVLN